MLTKENSRNPCKDNSCNACCQNMRFEMTLAELAKYTNKYRHSGKRINRMLRKSGVERRGMLLPNFFLSVAIWYAANKSLDEHIETGRFGETKAVVLLEGICPNNKNGECTIYENRPGCCKKLEVGKQACTECQNEVNTSSQFIPIAALFHSEEISFTTT